MCIIIWHCFEIILFHSSSLEVNLNSTAEVIHMKRFLLSMVFLISISIGDIQYMQVFVVSLQWSCLRRRYWSGGFDSGRRRYLTHRYSFHPNKRKPFRSSSVATATHLTQHFIASVALGCVNDCQHVWRVDVRLRHCFNMSDWRFSFFSPWTETSFLPVSTTSLKASSAPSHPPPPAGSLVPLKNMRRKRSERAVFSLLFHTWLTSSLTWFRTSLVSPKVFRTSGKCVP